MTYWWLSAVMKGRLVEKREKGKNVSVAQMEEQPAFNRQVLGSNPSRRTA